MPQIATKGYKALTFVMEDPSHWSNIAVLTITPALKDQ